MRRGRGVTAAVILVSLVAISAGAWGLSKWRPFADEAADIDWPDNVQPLVDYIEDVSKLEFRSAIDFEFIESTPTYNDRARDPQYAYTEDELAAVAVDEAVGRALGLWSGDDSIVESFDSINNAAPRPVRWFPADNVVLVNARASASVLPVGVRSDLIVYLTQALTDQHLEVRTRLESASTSQEYEGLAAAYVGFALWMHDQYIDDLSSNDREAFESDAARRSIHYSESVDVVPATFRSVRIAFQVLGHVFATALAEDDPELALRALQDDVPVALDQVSLPTAKYLREDPLETVDTPPGPEGATIHYSEQLGPMRLFLMFVTGSSAPEALTATDGWGNDRFTAYELDGRVCVDADIVADSRADADRLQLALNGWAFARPNESAALVGREGVHVYFSVCDPGTDVEQAIADDADADQYFGRADLLRQLSVDTGKPDLAECMATALFAQFTIDRIYSGEADSEVDGAFQDVEDECRNTL